MRGFKDNLPPISYKYDYVNKIFKEFSEQYCVDLVNLNYVEEANLYYRTSGTESEICQKELFEVRKFHGEYEGWVLRPEGTASCIRMVKENSYLEGKKIARLGYYGAMFRYNRPQKGRYRQFIQAGWEWLGSNDKYTDYEIIQAACKLLNRLNINYTLEINSIGNSEDRKNYRLELKNHLKIDQDPFKILDKLENIENIPLIKLNKEDKNVLSFILKKLEEDNINYKYNPYLVRGLDYYNGIVFEFKVNNQTVLAGGRYDGLMEQLGGKHTPAIGFAMGVDRIVDILDCSKDISNEYAVVSIDNNEYALKVLANLRSKNKKCIPYWGMELSKALKLIRKTYRYVVIIGETESKNNSYILKDLKNSTQETLYLE